MREETGKTTMMMTREETGKTTMTMTAREETGKMTTMGEETGKMTTRERGDRIDINKRERSQKRMTGERGGKK